MFNLSVSFVYICCVNKGFGGKFGVQNDRMDKSALTFQENPEKPGTNYTKVKPDIGMCFRIFLSFLSYFRYFSMEKLFIGSAKPSNVRAKFENFAKVKEEEDLKRLAEQKRLREEKDRLDREQASNAQQNGGEVNAVPQHHQPRTSIDTGRSGGIGNAISMFNRAEDKPITPVQRVSSHSA